MLFSALTLFFIAYISLKRPVILFIFGFFIFTFVLRTVSAGYLDVFTPVYSDNLRRIIYSEDTSIYYFLCVLLTLMPFYLIFNKNNIKMTSKRPDTYSIQAISILSNITFAFIAIYLTLLYKDLLSSGPIPLFICMERYDYLPFAGPLHIPLFRYGAIAAMFLGALTVYPYIKRGRFDYKHLLLIITMVIYTILTGHRFSAPLTFIFYYAMPFSVLVVYKSSTNVPFSLSASMCDYKNYLLKLAPILVSALLSISLVVMALSNSYLFLRSHGCEHNERQIGDLELASSRLMERIFIQPAELLQDTIYRMKNETTLDTDKALHYHFSDPGLSGGDVGIRYIMLLSVGPERENELFEQGVQFQGGYPEIFFVSFGEKWSWLIIFISSSVIACILIWWINSLLSGKLLSFFLISYMYFAITALYSNGSLTFLIATTFWIKVAAAVIVFYIESRSEYQQIVKRIIG